MRLSAGSILLIANDKAGMAALTRCKWAAFAGAAARRDVWTSARQS
jgi:hypothetical protein